MPVGVWLAVTVMVGIDKVGKMTSVADMAKGDAVTIEVAVGSIDTICAGLGVGIKVTTGTSNSLRYS